MPRTSDYTQDIGDSICERLAEGESLRGICKPDDMPSMKSVLRWLAKFPEFRIQYLEACEAREAHLFEEMREIADDGSNDWMDRKNGDGSTTRVVDHEHINRSKLRVDTIKWQLARMNPKKYGDRQMIEAELTAEVKVEKAPDAALDLIKRVSFVLGKAGLKIVPIDAIIMEPQQPAPDRTYQLTDAQRSRLGLPAPEANPQFIEGAPAPPSGFLNGAIT
jgi:hypothetical protein